MGAALFFLQKKRLEKWSEIQKEKCGLKKFSIFGLPYGVYNQLEANKLAVGDTNDDENLTAAHQPDADKAEDFGPLNERYLRKALQVY